MLEIQLLGRFEVTQDGRAVQLSSRPAQNLLAYLFLHPEKVHRREELAGLLWPESDESNARKYLSQSLWRLRKELGSSCFQANKVMVGINPGADFSVDVDRFRNGGDSSVEELTTSLSVYQGRLLPGFYEDWVATEAAVLQGIFERKMQVLLDRLLANRRWKEVIAWGEDWVSRGECPEPAFRAMMQAHNALGDRASVISVYRRCVEILMEDLGVSPSSQTEDLYEKICRNGIEVFSDSTQVEVAQAVQRSNPYRGLYAFRQQDSHLFFGREQITQRLLNAVESQPLTVLIGPSGCGKSSVVFAGLAAQLCSDDGWVHAVCRPGKQPFLALAGALIGPLRSEPGHPERSEEIHHLARELAEGQCCIRAAGERFLAAEPGKNHLLLILDQFEELYALSADAAERTAFLDQLIDTIRSEQFRPAPVISVLLTLRADFFGSALDYHPFAEVLQGRVVVLGPMNRQELSRAIKMPAAAQGAVFEAGLVERILDDIAGEPGHLPLLEFALTTLWGELAGSVISHEGYEAIGGVEGALSRYADSVFGQLGQEDQAACRQLFAQMVRPGEGTGDTRRLATREEVGEAQWPLAQKLGHTRLLVIDRDAAGHETVELVHEALIHGWDRMREWLAEERAFRVWQERLRVVIRQWEASSLDEGALLRGASLVEAEKWFTSQGSHLSSLEMDFIRASLDLRDRRIAEKESLAAEREKQRAARERLRKAINIGLAVALLVTTTLVILAGWQWKFAREAQANAEEQVGLAMMRLSSQLSSRALAISETRLDLALLLGVEAFRAADTFEARSGLQVLLTSNPSYMTRLWGESPVRSIAFHPDGRVLAAGYEDGSLILWDVQTAEVLRRLEGHTDIVSALAFSPDGRLLLSGGNDASLILWNFRTDPAERMDLEGHEKGILAVAFSPDGETVISGGKDKQMIFWETASAQKNGPPLVLDDWPQSLAFHPAGQVLATGSCARRSTGFCKGGEIRFWDVSSREPVGQPLTGLTSIVSALAYHPDGTALAAAGSYDDDILVWELSGGFEGYGETSPSVLTGRASGSGGIGIGYMPDGMAIFVGGRDGIVTRWDVGTKSASMDALNGYQEAVSAIAVDPVGDLLASASEDGSISLWKLNGDQPLAQSLNAIPDHFVRDTITGRATDRWVALTNTAGEIYLVDLVDPDNPPRLIQAHSGPIVRVEITSDNLRMASMSEDGVLKLWDPETGLQLAQALGDQETRSLQFCGGMVFPVPTLAISPDARYLASSSRTGRISVLELESGRITASLSSPGGETFRSLAFDPSGSYLVSGMDQGGFAVWDLQTGARIHTSGSGSTDSPTYVNVSPDGRKIIVSDRNLLGFYDGLRESDTFAQPLGDPIPRCIAIFGPEYTTLAVFQKDYTLQFWDLETSQPLAPPTKERTAGGLDNIFWDVEREWLATIDLLGQVTLWNMRTGTGRVFENTGGEHAVFGVGFSADRSLMMTSEIGGRILFWSTESGEVVWDPSITSQEDIYSVRTGRDGSLMLFIAESGEIYLWDFTSDRMIGSPLPGHTATAFWSFFSPSSDRILSISKDAAFLWDLRAGTWPDLACARANRNMTGEEWTQYFGDEPYRKTCPDLP